MFTEVSHIVHKSYIFTINLKNLCMVSQFLYKIISHQFVIFLTILSYIIHSFYNISLPFYCEKLPVIRIW